MSLFILNNLNYLFQAGYQAKILQLWTLCCYLVTKTAIHGFPQIYNETSECRRFTFSDFLWWGGAYRGGGGASVASNLMRPGVIRNSSSVRHVRCMRQVVSPFLVYSAKVFHFQLSRNSCQTVWLKQMKQHQLGSQ
jgi:hypothetical protein